MSTWKSQLTLSMTSPRSNNWLLFYYSSDSIYKKLIWNSQGLRILHIFMEQKPLPHHLFSLYSQFQYSKFQFTQVVFSHLTNKTILKVPIARKKYWLFKRELLNRKKLNTCWYFLLSTVYLWILIPKKWNKKSPWNSEAVSTKCPRGGSNSGPTD